MKIGIVNYGLGNVGSVFSAFAFNNYDAYFVKNSLELSKADFIVMAGVGTFKAAVQRIRMYDLWDALNEEVLVKKKPVLGICLGMQLFSDKSFEKGENDGLGWIKGNVVKMDGVSMRLPHIGWNRVDSIEKGIFKGVGNNFFYFMHSYHFVPEEKGVVVATTKHGDLDIVSAVRKDNIIGVQFHPEKSQGDGLRILRNCIEVLI